MWKRASTLVIDSLKGYFGSKDGLMPFVKRTVHYAKSSGRTSLTVIGDMGSFFLLRQDRCPNKMGNGTTSQVWNRSEGILPVSYAGL